MNKAWICFFLQLLLKVANSEWMLGVHVQHFQNLYNAEIRDGGDICCCDISYMTVPCVKHLTDLDDTACSSKCDPLFDVHFKVCFANGTCSHMRNEIACISNSPATWMSPPSVELYSSEVMTEKITNTTVYVDVWDSPADEGGVHVHLIDKFNIAIPGTVSNCVDESNSLTVQGQHGIGNLALAYFNLTTDPITSCSSADVSTFSTSCLIPTPTSILNTQPDQTNTSSSYLTTTLTISSCPVSTVTISSCPLSVVANSPCPVASLVASSLCPVATHLEEEATAVHPAWRTMAILFLVVGLLLVSACIALCVITCRSKKGLKSQQIIHTIKKEELQPSTAGIGDDNKNPTYDSVMAARDERQEDFTLHLYSSVQKPKKVTATPTSAECDPSKSTGVDDLDTVTQETPEENFSQHVYSTVHKEKKSLNQPRGQSGPMGQQVQSFYALAT